MKFKNNKCIEITQSEYNHIKYLISAMQKILNGYHDAKLVICGKGGMMNELQAQVNAMGISQKINMVGVERKFS